MLNDEKSKIPANILGIISKGFVVKTSILDFTFHVKTILYIITLFMHATFSLSDIENDNTLL